MDERYLGQGASASARRAAAGWMQLQLAFAEELPCRDDPELFFAERPDDVQRAKDLCRQCPIRRSCLDGARQRAEPWGVWGGELIQRGVVIADKRARGRPRKADVAA
jgi:WhiB family transcriptional regulator, redox-sensing transcriptional regulator